jgi:hypothetical protein
VILGIRKQKTDMCSIERATNQAKYHADGVIKRARDFEQDEDKKARLKLGLCRTCYYINTGMFAGAAMTDAECGICKSIMHFGSTSVDAICKSCSEDNGICKKCGGDIELKVRRKPYPFMAKTKTPLQD